MYGDAFYRRSPCLWRKLADEVGLIDGSDELSEIVAQIMATALFGSDLLSPCLQPPYGARSGNRIGGCIPPDRWLHAHSAQLIVECLCPTFMAANRVVQFDRLEVFLSIFNRFWRHVLKNRAFSQSVATVNASLFRSPPGNPEGFQGIGPSHQKRYFLMA